MNQRLPRLGAGTAVMLLTACSGLPASAPPNTPSPVQSAPVISSHLPAKTQMSFSADPACTTLPASVRIRTYSAASGGNLIDLGDAMFGGGDGSYLWHTVYANYVGDIAHLYFQDPPIWEQLSADQYVVIYGLEAVGPVGTLPATLPFAGSFSFCAEAEPDKYPECEVPEIVCKSNDHKLTISRP